MCRNQRVNPASAASTFLPLKVWLLTRLGAELTGSGTRAPSAGQEITTVAFMWVSREKRKETVLEDNIPPHLHV